MPAEVLSDNGKQFTGLFGKRRPAEVLFDRICRENGITQRLTKPRSPTTTGKTAEVTVEPTHTRSPSQTALP